MPQIIVSDWTYKKLDEIKKKEQHKSFDSVIRRWLYKEEEIK